MLHTIPFSVDIDKNVDKSCKDQCFIAFCEFDEFFIDDLVLVWYDQFLKNNLSSVGLLSKSSRLGPLIDRWLGPLIDGNDRVGLGYRIPWLSEKDRVLTRKSGRRPVIIATATTLEA